MPQGKDKTPQQKIDFDRMLSNVNFLYLGTTVLILLDLSYISRFWTQFEAWLSMQKPTRNGLVSAVGSDSERHHIIPIHGAGGQADLITQMLVQTWAKRTPKEAHQFLSGPDVTVTNQKDKEKQLPKVLTLNDEIRAGFQAVEAQIRKGMAEQQRLLDMMNA